MKYSVLYPVPGSISGRSFVSPSFAEGGDLAEAVYEEVTSGETKASEPLEALEELFVRFNGWTDEAPGFRSMSVGDVVVLDGLTAWICLSVGWAPVIVTEGGEGSKVELLAAVTS